MIKINDAYSIHWLAGIVEGEGCFPLFTKKFAAAVTIGMTDLDVMERVAEMMDARLHLRQQRISPAKPMYRVEITGKRAVDWMVRLYPHMGLRRKERIAEVIERWMAAPSKAKNEFCEKGHPLSGYNLYRYKSYLGPDAGRSCRECRNQYSRDWARNKRATFIGPMRPAGGSPGRGRPRKVKEQ